MERVLAVENNSTFAGDALPGNCELIEVRVNELKQLFNAIDPSPFRERDIDLDAEEFIVGWAREAHTDAPLGLLVHLERPAGPADEAAMLRDAVHEYFAHRADVTRRRLRQLFRIGRTSLLIGLVFFGAAVSLGQLIARALEGQRMGSLIGEVMLIGGWVAMWRPLEIFLYDWWPILAEERLYRRLAAMPVSIAYRSRGAEPEAWRKDWPAAPVRSEATAKT